MPFCMLFSLSEVLTSGTTFLPDKWIQCLNKEPLRIHTVQKRPWAMSWAGHIFCRFCGDSPPGFLFFLGCWRLASYKLPSWWVLSLPGAVGLLAASFIMCISHIIFSASSGYWAWDQRPLLFSQMQGALPTFHCPCREFRAYIWPAAPIKENVSTHRPLPYSPNTSWSLNGHFCKFDIHYSLHIFCVKRIPLLTFSHVWIKPAISWTHLYFRGAIF